MKTNKQDLKDKDQTKGKTTPSNTDKNSKTTGAQKDKKNKKEKEEDEDTGTGGDWGNPMGENADQSNQGKGI